MSDVPGEKKLTNLRLLPTRPAPTDEAAAVAHERAIQFLEEGLERAKKDKSVFALVILMNADGSITDGYSAEAQVRSYTIIGALFEMLSKFREKEIQH